MNARPRTKSALLWGVIAGLGFPVLTMGYRIVAGRLPIGIVETLAVALALAAVVTAVAYATEYRLTRKGRT
jgi:hypothetical protein